MPANTQTNGAPQSRVQLLLFSLFCTAIAYTLVILAVSLSFRLPRAGGRLFAFWSATTGSTSLFMIIGFFVTSIREAVWACRILLHFLVLLQTYSGAVFFFLLPEEFWEWLHPTTLYEVLVPATAFIAMLAIFDYAIDSIYVCATTQTASSDEGVNIVTIFRRWIAHTSTSSRRDNQPAAFTEAIPVRRLHAEANTGNFTRLFHMVQKMMYQHRLPARIDPDSEKGRLLEDPEEVV